MTKSKQPDIKPSEITPESAYFNRRELLKAAVAAGLVPCIAGDAAAATLPASGDELANVSKWPESLDEPPNAWEDITTYNNYYEFGTGKGDPSRNAHTLKTRPWSVEVAGE